MKTDIETLRHSLELSYDAYKHSVQRGNEIYNIFNNRAYTRDTLNRLSELGQPAETFNIIRMFTRMLIGYYSTVINTIKPIARDYEEDSVYVAELVGDIVNHVNRKNLFNSVGDSIKLDGLLTGLMVSYNRVVDTGRKDGFGRVIYEIEKSRVPSNQMLLDPKSTKVDYSDARYSHRWKWVNKEEAKELFPISKLDKLDAYANTLDIKESEYARDRVDKNSIRYTNFEEYLIVNSIVKDKGQLYDIHWSGDTILSKVKIIESPYTIVKIQDTDVVEYQSIFEDVVEPSKAINQALLQIQLLVNTDKVLVQDGAVDDIAEFESAWKRVNAIIPTLDNRLIKVENMSSTIAQQYIIIDKALSRVQMVLGINDSFLGMAFATDSGRKVKLQRNATIMSLRYINTKLDVFYYLDGWKTIHLIKRYYRAEQAINIADEVIGRRWLELNKPLIDPDTGDLFYTEAIDPDTGKPLIDEIGRPIMVPINHPETDIEFADIDIELESVSYDDEDEKGQLLLETLLNGSAGSALMTVNPAGYFKALALNTRIMKTRYSKDIVQILEETGDMLTPQPQRQEELGGGGKSPMSEELKLPQNTNERGSDGVA